MSDDSAGTPREWTAEGIEVIYGEKFVMRFLRSDSAVGFDGDPLTLVHELVNDALRIGCTTVVVDRPGPYFKLSADAGWLTPDLEHYSTGLQAAQHLGVNSFRPWAWFNLLDGSVAVSRAGTSEWFALRGGEILELDPSDSERDVLVFRGSFLDRQVTQPRVGE